MFRIAGALAVAGLLVLPLTTAETVLTSPGPFAGTVKQGETDQHQFDNRPFLGACLQVMADYTVSLSWQPATDSLTLTAAGRTITGSNGFTAVGFQASYCTTFPITVEGTDVAAIAGYEVTVTRSIGGGGA